MLLLQFFILLPEEVKGRAKAVILGRVEGVVLLRERGERWIGQVSFETLFVHRIILFALNYWNDQSICIDHKYQLLPSEDEL